MLKACRLTVMFTAALFSCVSVGAAELTPHQQAALQKVLATMDPPTQAVARPHLEQTLATLGDYEIDLMLASMETTSTELQTDVTEPPPDAAASEEDLRFNRAQYEPAIRRAWQASHRFDEFVDAALVKHCPKRDAYALYGAAWRYEVYPLQPEWSRASDNADQDVEILGASYAPQDGRYEFDFSTSRNEFSATDVERAISNACAAYRKVGEDFMKEARPRMTSEDIDGGSDLERAANARAANVRAELEQALSDHAPTGNLGVLNALMNGRRID